jgi:hypothetical protein
LIDRVRRPIDFRRVVIPPEGGTTDLKGGRPGRSIRSGFWASLPRSVRFAVRRCDHIEPRPATVPALGFASCRVVGHALCALACGLDPASRHQPPACGSPAGLSARGHYGASFPASSIVVIERLPRDASNRIRLPGLLMVPACAPALQRIVGLMPGRSGVPFGPPDRLPV